MSPAEIAYQQGVLKEEVCPLYYPDTLSGCELGIDNWWDDIMESIGRNEEIVAAICIGIDGSCAPQAKVRLVNGG